MRRWHEWWLQGRVGLELLVDVDQRRRRIDAEPNRERETVRLRWSMIWILAEDHDLDVLVGTRVQGLKDMVAWWIDRDTAAFVVGELLLDCRKVLASELAREKLAPCSRLKLIDQVLVDVRSMTNRRGSRRRRRRRRGRGRAGAWQLGR